MDRRIAAVLRDHPRLRKGYDKQSGLRGWLGDPSAKVWFISEAPSAWRLGRNRSAPLTPEDQWNLSPGDKRLRRALVKARFKRRGADDPDGWHCYLTVLSKSAVRYRRWRTLPMRVRMRTFEGWAPVLAWELETGRPRVLVAMGKETLRVLRRLERSGLIRIPGRLEYVWNYGYLMQPGTNKDRVARYERQIVSIAAVARRVK